MKALAEAGISMQQVTDQLLADGVRLFSEAFDKLLAAIRRHSGDARVSRSDGST
jgi:transaldolase/glucose-6-phosphate isomerase